MPIGKSSGIVGRFVFALRADLREFTREMKRGENRIDDTERATRSLQRTFRKTIKPVDDLRKRFISLRGAMVGIGAATGIGLTVKRISDVAAEVQHMAERIDLSGSTLQRWRLEVESTGASFGNLSTALTAFGRRRAEAIEGNKSYLKVFEQLNIQLKDASGNIRNNEVVLKEFLQAVKGIDDVGEQLRVLQALFSESGRPLRTWIANADDVAASLAHLKTNTDAELISATDLNQAFDNMGHILKTSLISAIAGATTDTHKLQVRFQELADKHVPTLVNGIKNIGKFTITIAENWRLLLAAWTGVKFASALTAMKSLVTTIKAAKLQSQGLGIAWAGLKTTIPGIIATVIASVVLYREEIGKAIEDTKKLQIARDKERRGLYGGETSTQTVATSSNPALRRATIEWREAFETVKDLRERIDRLQRGGVKTSAPFFVQLNEQLEKATDELGRIADRRNRLLAQVNKDSKQAVGTSTTTTTVGTATAEDTTAANDFLRLQQRAATIASQSLADRRVAFQQFSRNLSRLDTFQERFNAKRERLKEIDDAISDEQLRYQTHLKDGEIALAEGAREQINNLREMRDQVRGIKVEFDQVKTTFIGTGTPTTGELPLLNQRSNDALMKLAETYTRVKSKMEVFGEAGTKVFSGLNSQIQTLIVHSQSWEDGLKRLTLLLANTALNAFLNPNFLGQIFGGPASRTVPITRALGGTMYAGSVYEVGDRGSEYIVPKVESTAIPARNMGGANIIVNTNVTAKDIQEAGAQRISDLTSAKVMGVLSRSQLVANSRA